MDFVSDQQTQQNFVTDENGYPILDDDGNPIRRADQQYTDRLLDYEDDPHSVPRMRPGEEIEAYNVRLVEYYVNHPDPEIRLSQEDAVLLVNSMWREEQDKRAEEAFYNESKQMAEEREMEQHNARFELLHSFESAFNRIKGSIRKAIEAIQTGRYADSPEEKNILTLLITISNKNLSDSNDISIDQQTKMSALVQKSFNPQNPRKQLSQSDIDNINDLKSTLDAYNMLISEGQLYGGKTKRRSRKTKKAGKRKHARRRGTRKW